MNIIKVNKDEYKKLDIDIKNCKDIFLFKEEDKLIGYGIIKSDLKEENIIEVFVYEEFRGNGYGTKIFGYLYDELKKLSYRELLFIIDSSNIRIINIISKYDGIHLSTNGNLVKYVVPIK